MDRTITRMLLAERAKNVSRRQVQRALDLKTPSMANIDASYRGHLLTVQAHINREVKRLMESVRSEIVRTDSLIDNLIHHVFGIMGDNVVEILESAFFRSGVLRTAERVQSFNSKKYDKNLYRQLAVNALPPGVESGIVNNWISSNVNLITKTNTNQVKALESLFRDRAFSGMRSKDLEADIQKIFGGTRSNVKLIARDQTHKLNSFLDMQKQTNAGIDGYYWRGTNDERRRPKHAAREGMFFPWSKPPDGGHPGYEYQCRCTAEPAIDRALLSLKEWKADMKAREPEEKAARAAAIEKSKQRSGLNKKKRKG